MMNTKNRLNVVPAIVEMLPFRFKFNRSLSKRILLCTVYFIYADGLFGQKVIPPSPVSSEFARYVTQEVSLYNGMPDISIPLYTIKLKEGLTIPISLSYNASGIRFRQDDGAVGVGWVINPGYRISRNIYGYADETYPIPVNLLSTLNNLEGQANLSIEGKLARDQFLAGFVPGGGLQNNSTLHDGEYDQFVFSTPNNQGEFLITDMANKKVQTIVKSNMQFDFKVGQSTVSSVNGIIGFLGKDEFGNKFEFGEFTPQLECNNESTSAYYGGYVATAWGLSKISTPQGDNVQFKYTRGTPGKWTDHNRSFSVRETNPMNCLIATNPSEPGGIINIENGYSSFYTKEISTNNETVVFNYDNLGVSVGRQLYNIQIKYGEQTFRTIEFYYSLNSFHRFLDKVTIFDSNHTPIESYQFDYISKNTNSSFICDHYGYYLETTSPNKYFHTEFNDDPILVSQSVPGNPTDCGISNQTMDFYLSGNTISREPNSINPADYFSLKKITYPTGGYTEYTYEPGRYSDVLQTAPAKIAGIRIKTITSYDKNNSVALTKTYKYGQNESGIGVSEYYTPNIESLFVGEQTEFNKDASQGANPILGNFQRIINYSTSMQGNVGVALTGSGIIKYPVVTEYYSTSSLSPNGKTEYYYTIGNPHVVSPLSSRISVPREYYTGKKYITHFNLWDTPVLSKKIEYSLTGGQYLPARETKMEYESTYDTYTGLLVEPSVIPVGFSILSNSCYASLEGFFNFQRYTITAGENRLKKETISDFTTNNAVEKITKYSYKSGSLKLLEKTTYKIGVNDSIEQKFNYPSDLNTGVYASMVDLNMVNYPIEVIEYKNGNIVGSTLNEYIANGSGFVVDKKNVAQITSPLPGASFSYFNGIVKDSRYPNIPQLTFDLYDTSNGNILQYHKDVDSNTSFIWTYNKLFPVVKGENVSYDILNAAVIATGASNPEAYWSSFDNIASNLSQQIAWRNFNTLLRSNPTLGFARITTYTYSPKYGMTSETDPNGKTTYYEYDSFGRLKLIKDNDGKVMKKFDYHYATTNQ